jgi:tRNA threonylcarbamoyladenosine biosynthesis protein TsaE|tara:strand:+ start:9589 stop:10008 length:420 start_codon:yes stop_codon:yes gene_type:complete
VDISYSLNSIQDASNFIVNKCKSKLILFEGDLGSGKTTLIKRICTDLGTNNTVSSPTFPILNIYDNGKHGNIFHVDLFRVDNISDLNELGFYEVLDLPNWIFIEWPDKFKKIFDKNHTLIKIKVISKNKRKLSLTNHEF